MNGTLYVFVVLIWGTTWIGITLQQGHIEPAVAIFWRFLLAASVLFVGLFITKRLKKLTQKDHLFCVMQGFFVFSFNFFCIYHGAQYINSGLEAVIFSMAVLFNTVNARIFFKQEIPLKFYPAALLGFLGTFALFWHDLTGANFHVEALKGIALCMLGTYSFSLGNMISTRHQQHQLDVFTTNAYGMLYGTVVIGFIALCTHGNFFPSLPHSALGALIYLSLIGSVVGFSAYFLLIGRIGASKAAYSTLLFPLVALIISTIWEGYEWHLNAVIGLVLILLGNAVFFMKKRAK